MQSWREYTERVRDASLLEDVVRSYGAKLAASGRNRMTCSSPLREDRDPSFMVYTDQQSWCDFGTRETGDVFDLVQAKESCSFADAVKLLGERAGIPWGGKKGNGEAHDPEIEAEMVRVNERRFVEKISTEAAEYYHSRLPDKIRGHLQSHYGFNDDTIDRQRIGWSDGTLLRHLKEDRGHTLKDILKTGLFIRTEDGRVFEHHEQRITFPYPRDGKYPYMISRRVDGITPDTKFQKAKYRKTLVQKRDRDGNVVGNDYVSRHVRNDVFYGEDSAKRKTDKLTISEGVTDAITLIMCGWPVISPVTTRFKKSERERCVKLSGNAKTVVIINDHEAPRTKPGTSVVEQPGLDGAQETAKELFEAGYDARVGILPLPDGHDKIDVNEFVRDNGEDALAKVIKEALPYPEFLIWRVPKTTRPVEIDEALAPAYQAIASCPATQREAYINSICDKFGLTKDTVNDAVAEFLRALKGAPAPTPSTSKKPPEPPTPPAAGSGSGSSQPPSSSGNSQSIHGAVFEHPDGYYYCVEKDKEGDYVEVKLSNFVLIPKSLVEVEGDTARICCDVKLVGGRIAAKDAILRENTFCSLRDFRSEIQRHYRLAVWNGKDINVGGVLEMIREANPVTKQGVLALGYTRTAERDAEGNKIMVPKWIGPDYIITKDGLSTTSDIVYANDHPAPLSRSLNMSGAMASDADIRKLAQRVVPQIFKLNRPEVILPTLGWFYASAATPVIREVLGHMPTLFCWGTQGCLAGDTEIVVNRAGAARRLQISELVRRFHGGKASGKVWRKDIATRIPRSTDDGYVRLGTVQNAFESGVKNIFKVTTIGGRSIRATADHRFLTAEGWKRLSELEPGNRLYVNGGKVSRAKATKKVVYRQKNNLKHHPYTNRAGGGKRRSDGVRPSGYSVPTHRLVIEAKMNGLSMKEFISRLRSGNKIEGLQFLDRSVAVHHKDGNKLNNKRSNLEVTPSKEHHKQHGVEGGWKNCAEETLLDRIRSIDPDGQEMTYDITMADEPHNFIANDFVVHNSGKTTFIRDVFWPLLGVRSEPFSCQSTKFTMLVNLSSVVSIPLVYDEYKHDLAIQQQQLIQRFLRAIYVGEDDFRGRGNLSVVTYRMVPPLCIIGEMMPTDPAILERTLTVSPMKHTITPESRKTITSLGNEKLQLLAGHYVRFLLGRDLRADLEMARRLMQAKMIPLLKEPLPSRLFDNLLVAVFGDYLHQQWCDSLGVVVKNRPTMEKVFVSMVAAITNSEEGGGVRDAFDTFLESISTYAHLGIIREGVHYALVDGQLCLHLRSCYDAYLVARRKANLPDQTNGLTPLRRVISENKETGRYVVDTGRRITLSNESGGPSKVRTVVVDMSRVPGHLDVDEFPANRNRSHGGSRQEEFDRWN